MTHGEDRSELGKNLTSILRAAAVSMTGDTRPTRLDTTPEGARPTYIIIYTKVPKDTSLWSEICSN